MYCFNFEKFEFDYEPYPIGLASEIILPDFYQELVRDFPQKDLFIYRPNYGKKWSLSETDNPDNYYHFIKNNPTYFKFYRDLKSKNFILNLIDFLKKNNIDLAVRNRKILDTNRFSSRYYFNRTWLNFLNKLGCSYHLNARFEFSRIPLDGGHILPHTDSPQKIVTIVIPIVENNNKNIAETAGTSVLKPKDIKNNYNQINRWLSFDEVETVKTFPFMPNKSVIFVKTFNSLHGVYPLEITSDKEQDRRSLTINIEYIQKHYGSRTF